ncbi:MAG TPA: hypothetical protein VID19_01965 [Candidatus Eremiobacteraceae bacterium]
MSADVRPIDGVTGAGKTTALAALAATLAANGRVVVVCSHEASCRAFRRALCTIGAAGGPIIVDTLVGHLARMLRADHMAAMITPNFTIGGPRAVEVVIARAARGLLDLTWAELRDGSIDLDLPFARRPGALIEAAGDLCELLRRTRVSAEEFAEGAAAGLGNFYGDDVERARELLAQAQATGRGSKRARESMRASGSSLRVQRRAERDLAVVLAHLYREYVAAARLAPVKTEGEIIGSATDWLLSDAEAAARAFDGCSGMLVDDAEDAEPALREFLEIAAAAGVSYVAVAGRESAAVDELHGRRALVPQPDAHIVNGGPPASGPQPQAHRFASEIEESDWIADRISALLRAGAAPDEIAVLARDREAAQIYAGLLAERGLPALPPASAFAAPDDIADLFALAHVVEDPYDQARLLRVLASPLVGFSDASLWTLCGDATPDAQLSLDVGAGEGKRGRDRGAMRTRLANNVLYGDADGSLPESSRAVLQRFRSRLAQWSATCMSLNPAEAFAFLAHAAGFTIRWRLQAHFAQLRLADDAARIEDALAAAAGSGVARTLRAAADAVEDGLIAPRPAARTAAALICDGIVEVKGEHFTHVIVAGVAHERFPRIYLPRAMAFSRKYGLIVRDNVADGAPQTAKFAWYYAKFDAKRRYLDGERRALRYALSRGIASAAVTGYGFPPRWAKDEDLLAEYLPARP